MSDSSNPLLSPSDLPFGVPPYDRISASDYLPAFTAAFAEQLQEIRAITRARSLPTFGSILVAWQRSGATLRRVANTFYTVSSADSRAEIQAVEEALAPLYSAHQDAIMLDEFLFQRVSSLWEMREDLGLTGEDAYLLERTYRTMVQAGAALGADAKQRLTVLNQQLSTLSTRFEMNLLSDTNDLAILFDSADDLHGLAQAEISAAHAAAHALGEDGWLLPLVNFTNHPALAQLTQPASREAVAEAMAQRGRRGNEFDNRAVVLELIRLRAERARLLGFDSHAAAVTADETAGSPEAVVALLTQLAAPAIANARAEAANLQRMLDADESDHSILRASDWSYYTEQLRREMYDIDEAALRPWFEASRALVDGVFAAATALYGVTFVERHDLPTYHPDVRVFDVVDADGTAVGLYLLDLYTRDSKHGGAWMNPIVEQSGLEGFLPVVMNNLNVPRPHAGPTLLTLAEVTTLFHEFGHALHGLFARTMYPLFSGTNVYRDFVEFPSQVNEMWMWAPSVIANYARHHETGEPLDPAIIERIQATQTFNQGFLTTEYLAAAWIDFAWHSLTLEQAAAVSDVDAFEAEALAELGLDLDAVLPRYRSATFSHIFAGGYSAGYYSYVWSEVLDADTVEWFGENGGLTRENGDRFRRFILGVGGSEDPLEAYQKFRGRDAVIAPLLTRRGLNS